MKNLFYLLLIVVFYIDCYSAIIIKKYNRSGILIPEWISQGVTKNYIFSQGLKSADIKIKNKTQRMANSRTESIYKARINMLSVIKGITVVKNALKKKSDLVNNIINLIENAEIIITDWNTKDDCTVNLRLSKQKLRDIGFKIK